MLLRPVLGDEAAWMPKGARFYPGSTRCLCGIRPSHARPPRFSHAFLAHLAFTGWGAVPSSQVGALTVRQGAPVRVRQQSPAPSRAEHCGNAGVFEGEPEGTVRESLFLLLLLTVAARLFS